MVMYMKENGLMIKLKVTEYILIWMEHNIKDSGKKISSMAMVKRHGLMEQCTKEIMFLVKSMVLVDLDGLTVPSTKDSF